MAGHGFCAHEPFFFLCAVVSAFVSSPIFFYIYIIHGVERHAKIEFRWVKFLMVDLLVGPFRRKFR